MVLACSEMLWAEQAGLLMFLQKHNKGRKQVFSVEFESVADIPNETINEIIQEAILLDETIPYASKRTKGG